MNNHKKKMIVPIVVTVIVALYYLLFFGVMLASLKGVWAYVLGIIPLALFGVMIYVCIERIREIKKGEEDDLSQY